ncbi:MAG: hypothetical protein GX221_06015 [Candidatus Riflebacteria bacterium]|nr:hypothetical protein [Candidatus Riflebacteria bacterium]
MKRFLILMLLAVFAVTPLMAQKATDFLPANPEIIININLKQLLSNPEIKASVQKSFNSEAYNSDYKKFLESTGIDPFESLDSVALFLSENFNPEKPAGAAIIKGKFFPDKFKEEMDKEVKKNAAANSQAKLPDIQLVKAKDGIYDIIPSGQAEPGKEQMFGFFDKEVIVAGTKAEVDKVRAVYTKKARTVTQADAVYGSLQNFNPKAVVSAAVMLNAQFRKTLTDSEDPSMEALSNVKSFLLNIIHDKDLNLELAAHTMTPQALPEVQTALNGYLTMIKGFLSDATTPSPNETAEQKAVREAVISVNDSIALKKVAPDAVMLTLKISEKVIETFTAEQPKAQGMK